MKQNYFYIYIICILALTSCRSFRQLSSKDNNNSISSKRHSPAGSKTQFIDNIEVTPGSAVSSKHKTSIANAKNPISQNNTNNAADISSKFNMENSSYLQLKFSVLVEVSVDKLGNIALLEEMDKWWGTRYCMGGSTENCLDCSAFTQIMLRDVYKIVLPRTAQEQYNISEKIADADLREGDLVFFHTGGRNKRNITHVGVYLQNNKFVHAATSGGVMISDLNEKYWLPKFKGGGRIR